MWVLLPLKLSTSLTSPIVKGWELGNHHSQKLLPSMEIPLKCLSLLSELETTSDFLAVLTSIGGLQ